MRLGRNRYAHDIVWAKFTPIRATGAERDSDRPIVQMLVALNATKRREVYAVHVSGDAPFSSTSIRLPLDAMGRAAIAACSYRLEGDAARQVAVPGDVFVVDRAEAAVEHRQLERMHDLERDARMRGHLNAITDDELERVAEIVRRVPYRQRRAAIQEELKVSYSVAKSRIAEARRRGYLDRERLNGVAG